MNNIPNRKIICDLLLQKAKNDKNIIVLCSDSRGSASMTPFFEMFPSQSVEVGIAEQNLVSISAGLAKTGKKAFCFSPACFLSTRSYEQVKIDVCYSNTNVKLVGISGGISYGELGMSHHSCQDLACMQALPNIRVYIPSDRFQTKKLFEHLCNDSKPAYIRVGRNPVKDVYSNEDCPFIMDKATKIGDGNDILIVACGEMVYPAKQAILELKKDNIGAKVLDMYCVKPIDKNQLIKEAKSVKCVITIEEHSPFGGLGATVSQIISSNCPKKVVNMSLPDSPVITGKSQDVFDYYKLNVKGICDVAKRMIYE